MVSKKASRGPVSKVSSGAAPAESAATLSTNNKSSVLRSAFSPSEYQLALFASVIQGLDAHHLRIHDVNSGRLQCDHAVSPKESITSLDWGYYGEPHRDQHLKKKRKRSSGANGIPDESDGGDVVVAFGTSTSEIHMYSPAEDKVTGTLSGAHERGTRDFKFTVQKPGREGWSIGGDGKLVQWDLRKGRSIRVVSLPSTSVTTLAKPVPSNPPVLCASQTPYIIDLEKGSSESEAPFSAMKNTIHTLISSSAGLASLSEEFLAADSDRYINIFDSQKRKLLGSLVADKEVECLSFYRGSQKDQGKGNDQPAFQKQVLAAVTRDGAIEIFAGPFHQFKDSQSSKAGSSLKSLRKSMTRRADAVIRVIRPDKSRSAVPVVSACFQGPDLVIAWVEGGVNLLFDRIRWQKKDSEDLSLQGEVEIVKAKSASLLGSATANGVKYTGKSHVDETHTVVEQGGIAEGITRGDTTDQDVISIPSDEEDDHEGATSQSENEETEQPEKANEEDVEMADAEEEEGYGEPSFGELLRANNAAEPIDVEAALEDTDADVNALVSSKHASGSTSLTLPSGLSLATVLSQSLKTNDNSLLESCFHTTDLNIVRATIQRIDSSLAATLLQKLAERLSTRPGRYGHLLVWVQWTCVAHGGAIAGRPEVLKQMTSLFKVMDQRSASLSSLLLLKGKLDMLDAQLGLRQSLLNNRAGAGAGMDSDDEEGVIYVEGQEDEVDDENETKAPAAATKQSSGKLRAITGDEEDDDEDMPLVVNGVASDDEEDDEENAEDEEELVDDEAGVSVDGADEASDDEEDDEEDEDEEGDDESMENFIADSDEESEISLSTPPVAPPSAPSSKSRKTKNKDKAGKR